MWSQAASLALTCAGSDGAMPQFEWIRRFVVHALTLEAAEQLDPCDLNEIAKNLLTAQEVIYLQLEMAAGLYFAY